MASTAALKIRGGQMIMNFKSLITITVALLTFIPGFASAEDKKLVMMHRQILPVLLPDAGRPTTLEVLLPNNKDLSIKVTAEVILDGVLLNIPMDGRIGEKDRTVYKTVLKAPIKDLVYRFHAQGTADSYSTTEQFKIERICEYQNSNVDANIPEDKSGIELARSLSEISRELERENESYSDVLASLKRLQEEIK
jgi:hypothetical protein